MRFAVCVFPGSNCDYDTYYVIRDLLGQEVSFVDYTTRDLKGFDCVVIPGGFSFGDYLRAGVLASKTSLGKAIVDFAQKGGLVLGICNGFQILTELELLPGALLRNENMRFICKDVYLREEDVKEIAPAVEALKAEGYKVEGPLSPDSAFLREDLDLYLCMYHDQGLIPFKLLAFKEGVNLTLGLPFIRTSPDHGVAYDIAWKGIADESPSLSALRLCEKLVEKTCQ